MISSDSYLDRELFQDFSDEIKCSIDEIVGKDANESQKEELVNSILYILHKQTKKLQNSVSCNEENQIFNFPNSTPSINIILFNQPSISPSIQSYPCYFNNPAYQLPMIQQQQQLSVPSYFNYYQPQLQISKPKKKKSNETKPHKSKKDKKKSKHTKSKKDQISKQKVSSKKSQSVETFEYIEGHEFEGIFNHLTKLKGENIGRNGTISITSNSICNPRNNYDPSNLLDDNEKNYASTVSDSKIAWICFDFKDMVVQITGYSIKSSNYTSGHLKSWVIEISDDNQKWETIDSHSNCTELRGKKLTRNFSVTPHGFARYCRLRHTESVSANLEFNRIEFFGSIKKTKDE